MSFDVAGNYIQLDHIKDVLQDYLSLKMFTWFYAIGSP